MEILTAADAERQQRRVAGGLQANGLVEGDRVALLTSSSGLMLSAILGALRTGIVPVLLNNGLLAHERDALLADADPALVVDDALLARLAEAAPCELAPYPRARPMHYTSGTTGVPKGVWSGVLSDAESAALCREEQELWQFDAADRHLVCSPFHHSVAIRFGGGTLLAGGTVIILGKFDAATAAEAIATHDPTTTFMVPAHLQRYFALDTRPRHRFRLLVHAGAPCPPPLKRAAIDEFGTEAVWEFYGSTEGQFTACSAGEWLDRPETVGRARPHRRLTVDDDGTIWCDVPSYGRFEYWRDPAKTATAWRRPSRPSGTSASSASSGSSASIVAEGFGAFTVGDLGRLDGDGYLYLDGRRDDLIISGGVNVYPAEVERALISHDGVEQVAVFGVPDERWGQRVCAAVVGRTTPRELLAFSRTQLAAYKCPKDVFVVDELPHTATGKVQRSRLPELLGLVG
jgi:acyl-CoA synthetase (AMP-forming)/AMP-acid ligase II